MDARMLRYYSQELSYMREMGTEFAAAFPKIAARLALDATEVADPYVERLLEGFSFLSARVRLKLDAEFPRFTQHLLDVLAQVVVRRQLADFVGDGAQHLVAARCAGHNIGFVERHHP